MVNELRLKKKCELLGFPYPTAPQLTWVFLKMRMPERRGVWLFCFKTSMEDWIVW